MPLLDVRIDHLKMVEDILQQHVPEREVWAFGSRAKWLAKEYSDLDLCILGEKPLSFRTLGLLEEAFEDSNLPYKVDIVDWATTSESFRKIIEKDKVVVQKGKSGVMGNEWNTYLLEDCMDAIIDYRGKTPQKTTHGIPLITAKIVKDGAIQPVTEFIAEADYESWMRRGIPLPGDIVMTTEAPLGEVAQLDDRKIALAQRVITLRGKKNFLDNTFLKYLLISHDVQHQLDGRGTGTTVKGIKQSELRKIELRLPDFHIQKQIGHILGALDNKITLNRQLNQTLEKIAQAIFKSWFVDFDPVKAKIAALNCFSLGERAGVRAHELAELAAMSVISGKDETQLAQLKIQDADAYQKLAQTAALFPAAMQESELGEIPEGWEVKAIGDFGKVTTGKTPPQKMQNSYADTGIPFITPTDVTEEIFVTKTNRYLSEIGQSAIKNTKIMAGSICVTCIGSQMGKAIVAPLDSFTNQQINTVIVKDQSHRNYLFLNLRNRRAEIFLIGSSGSTMPIINKSTFEKLSVLLPHPQITKTFDKIIQPMINQILKNSIQNWSLTEIRDSLLPKLLSGEITLTDTKSPHPNPLPKGEGTGAC